RTVVSFCNTGHWAASNWFALSEIAEIEDVRLYPESMVGWHATGS
ncbi:MAG: sulfurtransferase, partial [Pseudomonadota bacterium]